MIKHSLPLLTLAFVLLLGCKDDEDKKHANVKAEVRSVGAPRLALSSPATVESYKVPIGNIRLATGLNGSGCTSASPDFYSCPAATDAECAVDLTNASAVQNLLNGGANLTQVEIGEAKTYEGVAVEFCHEHSGEATTSSNYFTIWLKASVVINNITYYTNSQFGLSPNGPSEEVAIRSNYGGCGVTTKLLTPVVLGPDQTVNVVTYADPTGAVYGTTSIPSNNVSCVGNPGAYICSEFVSIFGTVDEAAPVVEHYAIDVTDKQDALVTLIFNSSDTIIGAAARTKYSDVQENPSVGNIKFDAATKNADGSYLLKAENDSRQSIDMFAAFKRENHSGTMITQSQGNAPYTATKL